MEERGEEEEVIATATPGGILSKTHSSRDIAQILDFYFDHLIIPLQKLLRRLVYHLRRYSERFLPGKDTSLFASDAKYERQTCTG